MAIPHVVTGGYGNGTFVTTVPLVVLRGYGIAPAIVVSPGPCRVAIVAQENRTVEVPQDSRTAVVPSEDRTIIIECS